VTFAYDPRGERVKKTTSSGSVRYPFAGYEIGSDGVITKRLGDVTKKSTGQVLFHHRDRLGSVHVITDSTGARVQLVEYDPWGSLSREEGAADLTDRLTEQELDRETGLYHFVGRYYDPLLSRFISPDPFAANFAVPQALNRYSYVRNNPVNRIDPTGFDDSDDSEEADPDGPPGEDPPGETNPPGAPEHE